MTTLKDDLQKITSILTKTFEIPGIERNYDDTVRLVKGLLEIFKSIIFDMTSYQTVFNFIYLSISNPPSIELFTICSKFP